MKFVPSILLAFVGVMLIAYGLTQGRVKAAEQLYSITAAASDEDAKKCGKAKGLAAMVANIDEDGDVISPFLPMCLKPTKP